MLRLSHGEVIRRINSMTIDTPFTNLLKEDFGVDVPVAAPLFQREYLYKYCLSVASKESTFSDQDVVDAAATKVHELFLKYPWIHLKYEEATQAITPKRVKKALPPDGTVEWCEKYKRYNFYRGGKLDSRAKKFVRLVKIVTGKYGNLGLVDPLKR